MSCFLISYIFTYFLYDLHLNQRYHYPKRRQHHISSICRCHTCFGISQRYRYMNESKVCSRQIHFVFLFLFHVFCIWKMLSKINVRRKEIACVRMFAWQFPFFVYLFTKFFSSLDSRVCHFINTTDILIYKYVLCEHVYVLHIHTYIFVYMFILCLLR